MGSSPTITRQVFRPGVARAIHVVVAEIPRFARSDQFTAASAGHDAKRYLRRPLLTQPLVRDAVAATGARRTARVLFPAAFLFVSIAARSRRQIGAAGNRANTKGAASH